MRLILAALMMLSGAQIALADNVANCEIFLRQPVMIDGEKTGAFIDTYAPGAEFIASVYDDTEGHVTEFKGQPIQAVFCTRHSVIPSLRDFPILATGLPFVVSTDFEASDSAIVTIYFKDNQFQHVYKGPDLSEKETAQMSDAMEIFNLQPHGLGK